MILSEILRLALSSLSANKLRSGLTMLGIAVGVFSVIGVMTVITGLRDNIESGLNVLGANSFQISKFPAINLAIRGCASATGATSPTRSRRGSRR